MEIGQHTARRQFVMQGSCKPPMISYALLQRMLSSLDDTEDDNIISLL